MKLARIIMRKYSGRPGEAELNRLNIPWKAFLRPCGGRGVGDNWKEGLSWSEPQAGGARMVELAEEGERCSTPALE